MGSGVRAGQSNNGTPITESVKDDVVRRYRDGEKVGAICDGANVSRQAVYSILAERGLRPNRKSSDLQPIGTISADTLLLQLVASERRVALLEAENAQLRRRLADDA